MAKLTTQQQERALQVAAVLASGIAVNGTMAEEKSLVHCCYTAARLVLTMADVCDAMEAEDTLADAPLKEAAAYLRCREVIALRRESKAAEAKAAAEAKEAKDAKGKKDSKSDDQKTDG